VGQHRLASSFFSHVRKSLNTYYPNSNKGGNLAKFNVEVDDELAKEFKMKIIEKYGTLRGNINKAFEEAIKSWIKEEVLDE